MTTCVCGEHPPSRQETHRARVALNDEAHDQASHELHVGKVVGAERVDELRAGRRLDDVVTRHRQERIGEHQHHRDELCIPHVDDAAERPLQ